MNDHVLQLLIQYNRLHPLVGPSDFICRGRSPSLTVLLGISSATPSPSRTRQELRMRTGVSVEASTLIPNFNITTKGNAEFVYNGFISLLRRGGEVGL
jgi:hypothetical protein